MRPATPPCCSATRSKGKVAIVVAWAFLLLLLGGPACAEFPSNAIEITVPFGAGNAADISARHLADGLAKHLGVSVHVVNRPGGGGAVAFTHVVQQRPDGYTLGYITSTISTSYYSGILPFDYTAYAPVAGVTTETPVLVVRADAPWHSVKEMVEDARREPGRLRIGNSGTGTHTHLSAAAVFAGAGVKIVDVPFGTGQAAVNLLGNRIEGVVQLPPAVIALVKSGDLRVLAALGSQRDRIFPETPTTGEAGFPVALDLWRGVVAPKGTPVAVIKKLEEAIRLVVGSLEFQNAGRELGFLPAFLSTNDFGNLISADDKKLAALMATLGLKKR
jgi:tripartite-type tricarboxylate transporter receptor subunit TctC